MDCKKGKNMNKNILCLHAFYLAPKMGRPHWAIRASITVARQDNRILDLTIRSGQNSFSIVSDFFEKKDYYLVFSWDSVLTVALTVSTTLKAASARAPTCNHTLWSNLEGIRIISASRSYLKKSKFKISDRRSFEYTIYQR